MGRLKTSPVSAIASETSSDSCLTLIARQTRDLAVWMVRRSSGQWCKPSARMVSPRDRSMLSASRESLYPRDGYRCRQDLYGGPAFALVAGIGHVLRRDETDLLWRPSRC